MLRAGARLLPARGLSCAGCHGGDAGGGAEAAGGPAIDWAALSRPAPGRGAYDRAAFARALAGGERPGGAPLAGAMPRFAFARPDDAAALAAYLEIIAAEQRMGIAGAEVFLRPSPVEGFSRAFAARVAELAPNGVFGRRIRLAAAGPVFATLGTLAPGSEAPAPDLFPLAPLLGDEDPARTRGAFAPVSAQVAALRAEAPGAAILGPGEVLARLGLPPAGAATMEAEVIALGAPALRAAFTRPGPVFGLADDLSAAPPPPGRCVTLADPRPGAGPEAPPPLLRYARAAAEVLLAALERCGPDCTRARLTRSFEADRIAPGDWPALDYRAEPLTGTRATRLVRLCAPG